nr:hypothetical protein [Tanacetum cinerariifolium]
MDLKLKDNVLLFASETKPECSEVDIVADHGVNVNCINVDDFVKSQVVADINDAVKLYETENMNPVGDIFSKRSVIESYGIKNKSEHDMVDVSYAYDDYPSIYKRHIIGGVIGRETEMTDVEASNGKIVKTLGITLKDSTEIVDCLLTSYLADKLLNYIITLEVKEMFYVKIQYAKVHYDGETPPMIYINKNIGSKLGILGANKDDDGSCVET